MSHKRYFLPTAVSSYHAVTCVACRKKSYPENVGFCVTREEREKESRELPHKTFNRQAKDEDGGRKEEKLGCHGDGMGARARIAQSYTTTRKPIFYRVDCVRCVKDCYRPYRIL